MALILCIGFGTAEALSAIYSEDAVKAAFLHRFAAYVEWPGPASDAPFVIAIAGAEGVAAELERSLPRLTVQGRPARLRRVARADDLKGVQILYVGPGQLDRNQGLVMAAVASPILVVTDETAGLTRSSIVNFTQVGRSVRFEISLTAAERSGLRINSGLLSVATRVEGGPRGDAHCHALAQVRELRGSCLSRFAELGRARGRLFRAFGS